MSKTFTNSEIIVVKSICRGLHPLKKKLATIKAKQAELELEERKITASIQAIEDSVVAYTGGYTREQVLGDESTKIDNAPSLDEHCPDYSAEAESVEVTEALRDASIAENAVVTDDAYRGQDEPFQY